MKFSKLESMINECFQSAGKSPLSLPIVFQNYMLQHGKNVSYAGPSYWQDTRFAIVYQAKNQQYLFSLPLCEEEQVLLYMHNLIQITLIIFADVNGQLIEQFKKGIMDKDLLEELNNCTEKLIQSL